MLSVQFKTRSKVWRAMASNLRDAQHKPSSSVSVHGQILLDFASTELEAAAEGEDGYFFVSTERLAVELT